MLSVVNSQPKKSEVRSLLGILKDLVIKKLLLIWKNDGIEEGVSCLPEDLVIESLVRLPVKSLLRFKSVCKQWYTLIKSPDFISLHYQHDSNPTDLVFHFCVDVNESEIPGNAFSVYRDGRLVRHQNIVYQEETETETVEVSDSVNGLFLLIYGGFMLEIWNPALQKSWSVPDLILNFPDHFSLCNTAWGFGLDPRTNEYKAILVQYFLDPTQQADEEVMNNHAVCEISVGVYNLATDSWNLVDPDVFKFPCDRLVQSMSLYLKGHHYWISFSHNSTGIAEYDISNDVCRELCTPTVFTYGHLSLYNDELALLTPVWSTGTIDVWVMELEGRWTKKLSTGILSEINQPLKLWKNNELFYEDGECGLVLYNISTRESRTIGITGRRFGITALEYKESLVSVLPQSNMVSFDSQPKKPEVRSLLGILKDLFINKASSYLSLAWIYK